MVVNNITSSKTLMEKKIQFRQMPKLIKVAWRLIPYNVNLDWRKIDYKNNIILLFYWFMNFSIIICGKIISKVCSCFWFSCFVPKRFEKELLFFEVRSRMSSRKYSLNCAIFDYSQVEWLLLKIIVRSQHYPRVDLIELWKLITRMNFQIWFIWHK